MADLSLIPEAAWREAERRAERPNAITTGQRSEPLKSTLTIC